MLDVGWLRSRQRFNQHPTSNIGFDMAKKVYDVCVVGSGASGGTLSAHLAHYGVDVVVVEGGPKINTRTAFNTHAMPFDFPNRHIPTMRTGVPGFESERSRGVGGKSMT